jgi:pimeloyl-ACP methyl ester carboxylesterase
VRCARFRRDLGALSAERTLHADLTQDTSVQDAAERLLATAPDRFIAVGFSLGAIVALELAARAPHRSAPWC